MVRYAILQPSTATAALAEQLSARGAIRAAIDQADLVLATVESTDDAARLLASIGGATSSTVLLGNLPQVEITTAPAVDNLEGILETYRPLGVLRSDPAATWRPMAAGFTGSKALADKTGAGVMKAFSTPSYGAWLRCDAVDAADFLVRIAATARDLTGLR